MNRANIRHLSLFLPLLGLLSCGGGDDKGPVEPDPPVATSVTVSQSSVSLSYLGQTFSLTATVRDQFQRLFAATVVWSSDNPSVATVAGGVVTAVGNGVTTVRATAAGSLSDSASVTVQQVATRVAAVSGDGQTGSVGQTLAEPLVVRSEDQGGSPVAESDITFTLEAGGSVSVTEATTDGDALASTTWTLGTTSGSQQLTAAIAESTTGFAQLNATAVAGPPAAIVKDSGDGQTVPVGWAVFEPVTVKLTDEYGNGVVGGSVSFAVTGGNGSVTPSQATTAEDGTAQTVWTMGAGLGVNTLSVTSSVLPAVEFTATAVAAKADLEPSAMGTSPTNPTALQTFEVFATVKNVGYLSASAGVQVQLLLDGLGAGTTPLPALAVGDSSEVSFTIGPLSAGTHTLDIEVDPSDALDEWDDDNNTAQDTIQIPVTTLLTAFTPVTNISAADSVEHLFTLEVPVSSPGTLEVTLSGGTGDPDLYVHRGDRPALRDDYECQSGNPDTTERCVINAAEPGTYHILIFAWDEYSGTTLLATTGGPVIPYDIELVFINHGTAEQDLVFEMAAARWMEILPGDISDWDYSPSPIDPDACFDGQPRLDGVIDDLRIYVDIVEIDGPGGTLARAGPCHVRGLGYLPIFGLVEIDSEDIDALAATGGLLPVVTHEMGHVLGIGTIWYRKELLHNPSLPANAGADTYFSGSRAITAFDAAGGSTYDGNKVPVANTDGEGSADSHWRESVLDTELMTPLLQSGRSNPLSAITIESLADLGYTVDITRAQPYALVFPSPARTQAPGTIIDLGGDVRRGTIYVMEEKGRVRQVVRR